MVEPAWLACDINISIEVHRKLMVEVNWNSYPRHSMYGIFIYIYSIESTLNVGQYTIHWVFAYVPFSFGIRVICLHSVRFL